MPKQKCVENVFVQCPYYKYERPCVIYCEGHDENSSIHMAFSSNTQKKEFEKQFCQDCWQKCIIADAHNRKWDYKA